MIIHIASYNAKNRPMSPREIDAERRFAVLKSPHRREHQGFTKGADDFIRVLDRNGQCADGRRINSV